MISDVGSGCRAWWRMRRLQWLSGYLGLALVFVWSGAWGRGLASVFGGFLASVNKIFILAWGLGTGLLFYWVWTLS